MSEVHGAGYIALDLVSYEEGCISALGSSSVVVLDGGVRTSTSSLVVCVEALHRSVDQEAATPTTPTAAGCPGWIGTL